MARIGPCATPALPVAADEAAVAAWVRNFSCEIGGMTDALSSVGGAADWRADGVVGAKLIERRCLEGDLANRLGGGVMADRCAPADEVVYMERRADWSLVAAAAAAAAVDALADGVVGKCSVAPWLLNELRRAVAERSGVVGAILLARDRSSARVAIAVATADGFCVTLSDSDRRVLLVRLRR